MSNSNRQFLKQLLEIGKWWKFSEFQSIYLGNFGTDQKRNLSLEHSYKNISLYKHKRRWSFENMIIYSKRNCKWWRFFLCVYFSLFEALLKTRPVLGCLLDIHSNPRCHLFNFSRTYYSLVIIRQLCRHYLKYLSSRLQEHQSVSNCFMT